MSKILISAAAGPRQGAAAGVDGARAGGGLLRSPVVAAYGVPVVLVTADDRTPGDAEGYAPRRGAHRRAPASDAGRPAGAAVRRAARDGYRTTPTLYEAIRCRRAVTTVVPAAVEEAYG
ncbi:hypothetical protein [Streptomyces sp. I05A-00742]|uniref:hypothetical protein n=1 Tax=Streptomyces sp. I05A-00742 TaxID=2732853 RepID=UPI001488018F|nr:hypothetical protein [Streptomyces sp. I05A-00742]